MYLRYKRYQQLAVHNVYTARTHGRQYVFTQAADGCCDVPYQQDVAALLNPTTHVAELAIAFDRLGIVHDATEKEVRPATAGDAPGQTVLPRHPARVQRPSQGKPSKHTAR